MKEPVSHADTVSNFSLTCWVVGTAVGRGGRPLCYPSPSPRNLLLRGQASEPSSFMHHSVCVLLPSIGISRVTSARYCRCSLSHDIVAMCGWRSISRYRLIDIIPSWYVSKQSRTKRSRTEVGQNRCMILVHVILCTKMVCTELDLTA